ncbi:hypothetical protein SERLADRAFT_442071 [Serpula lacrymans var. lacrymans S7.9]|nr:uncharacterized protein SERLADRAFT_442071 [Serpula lacrymans var. lacrymans S7.9]EGO20735.1 hypothetical protein SERLADRAFT_442071 [Serpula lacrymans var. lacrymans S7.9]
MSFSPAARTESLAILTYFLNNTTPQELHSRFISALSGRLMSPVHLENLLSALETLGIVTPVVRAAAEDNTTRHCVRCHRVYVERHNSGRACVIPHDEVQLYTTGTAESGNAGGGPGQVQGPIHVRGYLPCCKAPLDPSHASHLPAGNHFVGRHTTMVANVAYNATNIKTCTQKGCGGAQE